MNYKTDMEQCRNYIEAHICEEITPRSLAELLGYSFYHFCHVFRVCNNMPVGEYLRKQRLQHVVKALENKISITEIALTFGFDTPSGFSKAFRREFGISPSKYRKHIRMHLLGKKEGSIAMKVMITKKDDFKAVGYSIAPKNDRQIDIINSSAYWLNSDFSSVSHEEYAKLAKPGADQIGMWFHPDKKTGSLSYFFGPIVTDFTFVPENMITIEIPAADYAVCTTDPADLANDKASFAKTIQKAWKYIFEEWFENSNYIFDQNKVAFELYSDKNGSMHCNYAVADIYIPIKKK